MSNERSKRPSCSTTIGTSGIRPSLIKCNRSVARLYATHGLRIGGNVEVRREIDFPVPPDEVWEALTDPDQLEEWFANDVELDARPGGAGVFRWDDGEERHATVREVEPGERLVLDWDDEGEVVFTLEEVPDGTRVCVREVSAEWSTALELRATALA